MGNIVYHGSPNGNLDVIKSHISSHQKQCIYATESKVVAMLYMARGNGDLDTRVSSVNGKPEVVERRKGVLDKLYYSNILDVLREETKKGNLILYEFPNRPDNMPSDNSDLIEKYVNSEKKGNKGAIEKLLKIYPEFKDKVNKILR